MIFQKTLLDAAIAIGAGAIADGINRIATFQAWGTTTGGAGSADIDIQGSNNGGLTWDTIHRITLPALAVAASSVSYTLPTPTPYLQLRANLATLVGAGAAVSCVMSF